MRLAIWVAASAACVVSNQAFAQQREQPKATPVQRFFDWSSLQFPSNEYQSRRAAMISQLRATGGGVYLVPSDHGVSQGNTFRQYRDFLYFTGLELPGSILALDADSESAIVFAPAEDWRFANPSRRNDFPGRPLADDPALSRVSGIARIVRFEEFEPYVRGLVEGGRVLRVSADYPGELRPLETAPTRPWNPNPALRLHVERLHPTAAIQNAYDELARLRMVKSPREVAAMRRAADVTAAAILDAARRIADGVTERELQAEFEASCMWQGSQRVAFHPIIKSGPNSLWPWRILASHYDRRNRSMHDGDLVIFDVGCEVDYYGSDMGRTFPISGRFSDAQRAALRMSTSVSDTIIANARPGITLRDLQRIAEAAIPPEERPYMQTGLYFGHHIGLSSSRDPYLADAILEPGMIITVEPWYYNHDTDISVFIEDEILITAEGAEVLTAALPRSPEALENLVTP